MLQNQCKLVGYDEKHNRNTLVTGATLEFCENLVKHWIDNHPKKYRAYFIFVYNMGIWEARYQYEKVTDRMFQIYELKGIIKSKKLNEE